VIEHLRSTHPTLRRLVTSCVPGPGTPRPFYEWIGFVATGELDVGEEVLVLAI
jgi:diamine N-acetyltransferase